MTKFICGTLFMLVLFYSINIEGSAEADAATILAFPGAEGAGAYTVGGRGGSVYRVTNLNSSGPGSLADAVSQPNRIVVFTVSGIIDLSGGRPGKRGNISVTQPHITIAGQTAPGDGICLKNGALQIQASEVIVRHLRSRRGYVSEGDTGDAITVKVDPADHIILDHLSASWATDENFTVTGRINHVTAQYCLIAEALDYDNPNQTPTRHAYGSLFGTHANDGRVSFHHLLYAHHRRRCPQASRSKEVPTIRPVLDFRNCVVYDCSDATSHTGNGGMYLNWINNYYKAGPSTPDRLRDVMFTFNKSDETRMFASGNYIHGSPAGTQDNWRAARFEKKLTSDAPLRVDREFPAAPVAAQGALDAYETVLADAGAALPARDSVDWRIVHDVRNGTGKVIEKETDLPIEQRWPTYYSLPAPADTDADGIPDFWEDQFGMDKSNAKDSMKLGYGGYAFIEHYINNTDPTGGTTPLVHIAASVSRARTGASEAGVLGVTRSGSSTEAVTVSYTIGGSASGSTDYAPLSGSVTIPAGQKSATIRIEPLKSAAVAGDKTVTVTLQGGMKDYHVGCPSAAQVVIQK